MTPQAKETPTRTMTGPQIRVVALAHRGLMLVALVYLLAYLVVNSNAQLGGLPLMSLEFTMKVATIAASLSSLILALRLYSTGVFILFLLLLAFTSWLPIPSSMPSWILLLVISDKATRTLRSHGVKVGFLGAKLSTITSS